MKRTQTIKEWELEKGIKIITLKNKNKRCTKKTFKEIIKENFVTVKCQKGLDFLADNEEEFDNLWKTYIHFFKNRKGRR